jgi:glycosyltransferase involved in cell wall biosynthesis
MDHPLVVALVTVGDPNRLTGGFLYQRRIAELAPAHGARVVVVCFPERRFLLAALDAPRVLHQAAAAGARVIVLDSLAAALLGPWLALRGSNLPTVGLIHQPPGGIEGGALRRMLQRRLDRLAYRSTVRLMAASDLLAEQLIDDGTAAEHIEVVRPGRDVAAAAIGAPGMRPPDDEHPLRAGRHIAALCVANWLRRKGILELLEAVAQLPDALVTLHLAGDEQASTAYGARVRERLARADLSGRVVRHGVLPREDVAALYAGADLFVLPSFEELYGTVYGEAMALGLPVVGWRAGNLPYLIEHGREGLIVELGDVGGLAHALDLLAHEDALRLRMGTAGRTRAAAWPTWDDTAAVFFAALREVVSTTTNRTQTLSGPICTSPSDGSSSQLPSGDHSRVCADAPKAPGGASDDGGRSM